MIWGLAALASIICSELRDSLSTLPPLRFFLAKCCFRSFHSLHSPSTPAQRESKCSELLDSGLSRWQWQLDFCAERCVVYWRRLFPHISARNAPMGWRRDRKQDGWECDVDCISEPRNQWFDFEKSCSRFESG
jgi:hypothetical protein